MTQKRRAAIVFPDIDRTAKALGYGDGYYLTDGNELMLNLAGHANLRDGERAAAVTIDPARDVLILYIEGGWLPAISEGCESPQLHTVRLDAPVEVKNTAFEVLFTKRAASD